MILAAGLTPAWQEILVFDGFNLGHVNRAAEVFWTASGKVLNVGMGIHRLGGRCITLSLLGGAAGRSIGEAFTAEGIPHRWVQGGEATRVCNTILDRSTGGTTELVQNAAPVTEDELAAFSAAYKECAAGAGYAVLTGSLPPGTPRDFYATLIRSSRAPVILDASGAEFTEALSARPLCVKPNREELARSLGCEIRSDDDLRNAMKEVQRRGAEWVLVSQGGDALWACTAGKVIRYQPPRIKAVNPIASGDCLAAGLAWALQSGFAMEEAIRFGIAAAAENASMLMPARLELARVQERVAHVGMETR